MKEYLCITISVFLTLIILFLLYFILVHKLKQRKYYENFESFKKDIVIYSPGGVGCTVLFDFIKNIR